MKSSAFKDYFSDTKSNYKKFRPTYPNTLFEYLAKLAPSNKVALDCATGSGQAAQKLAQYFPLVIASDASFQQIQKASDNNHIFYGVAQAENVHIASSSVDIVTVAQALHWFATKLFFQEINRVLKSNGIIAVWTYNLLTINPNLDEVIKYFYSEIIGNYWPAERHLVEDGYKNLFFPFSKIKAPSFNMTAKWSLRELIGYLNTWSAVNLYIKDKGVNPLEIIIKDLCDNWGDPLKPHNVTWQLTVIIGKKAT